MTEFLRRLFRPYLELKKAIVNMKTGTAFQGVIYRQAGPYLIMRQAEIIQDRGATVKKAAMDGEVLLERSAVDFIQVVS